MVEGVLPVVDKSIFVDDIMTAALLDEECIINTFTDILNSVAHLTNVALSSKSFPAIIVHK